MDKTREPDIKIIEKGLKDPDPNVRRQALNAGNEIRKQAFDRKLKRRRQKLLHEIRHGREENARDIRETMMKGWEGGRFFMDKETHKRIFGK